MNLKLKSTGLFLEILNLKGRDQFVHMNKHQFILGISLAPFLRSPECAMNPLRDKIVQLIHFQKEITNRLQKESFAKTQKHWNN